MDDRSAIAKLCRAQCYPPRNTRLAKMVKCLPKAFLSDILPLCQTPLLAGFILQLVHLAPMDAKTVRDIYTQSMVKEVKVMESVKRTNNLCFEPFFGSYWDQIHPDIPCNESAARRVHKSIDNWIEDLRRKVLYPSVSSKTISKESASRLLNLDHDYSPNDDIGVTAIDLERVYHIYGVKIGGPCEMRQKWYCSQLKPRTYYCQGGCAYHTSKYLAVPFVDLCDTIPATNRRTRVDPGRIKIPTASSDVIYYDLFAFTSNLHPQYEFVLRLAKYCYGVTVHIMDSVEGIIPKDLGELIYEYARTNLLNPEYTLPAKYENPSEVHYHGVAGFLGVYGNIATATFLHGCVMSMMHDSEDENNVAGDDGLDVSSDIPLTLKIIGEMGEVQDEKTFRESEGCCIHLKRPITRIGPRLYHGQLFTWPSLEPVMKNSDNRYPYLRNISNHERKDALAGSVTSFLRKLENQIFSDSEITMIDRFLTYVYDTYKLPKGGCVPQITGGPLGFVPIYERRFIGMDPIYNTITRLYNGIAILPLRGHEPLRYDMLQENVFSSNHHKLLRQLQILGYLEQEKEKCFVYGDSGLKQLLQEYTKPEPPIYKYTVIQILPNWVDSFEVSNSI